MRFAFPHGWLSVGADADEVFADQDAYPVVDVLAEAVSVDAPVIAARRFAALQSAVQTASGGSYFVRLGGSLRPGPAGALRIEVAVGPELGEGLDRVLAAEVMKGARRAAGGAAGVLRFDRARVHPVDGSPRRHLQAAATLGRLLAEPWPSPPDAALAARAAALWSAEAGQTGGAG